MPVHHGKHRCCAVYGIMRLVPGNAQASRPRLAGTPRMISFGQDRRKRSGDG
jgi:hypothetical protein